MRENKEFLIKGAMTYGLPMGIYWCIKYLFLIFGYTYAALLPAYEIMTLGVIVIAYYMTKAYRETIGGYIGFYHAWQFGVLLYFFSALILSVEQYVFFRYLAPADFLSNLTRQATDLLQQMKASPEMMDSVKNLQLTPIMMTIQGIFNNTFYGIIFSLPIAALIRKKDSSY